MMTIKMNNVLINMQTRLYLLRRHYHIKIKESEGAFFTEDGLRIMILVAVAVCVLGLTLAMVANQLYPDLGDKLREIMNTSA